MSSRNFLYVRHGKFTFPSMDTMWDTVGSLHVFTQKIPRNLTSEIGDRHRPSPDVALVGEDHQPVGQWDIKRLKNESQNHFDLGRSPTPKTIFMQFLQFLRNPQAAMACWKGAGNSFLCVASFYKAFVSRVNLPKAVRFHANESDSHPPAKSIA